MSKRQALTSSAYLDTSEDRTRIASADTFRVPGVRYENSYQLAPDNLFPAGEATKVIQTILEEALNSKTYNKEECYALSRKLADKIKDSVKKSLSEKLRRYKLVSYVVIGETDKATIAMVSRCVWNDKFDTQAEGMFKNSSLYAVGIVYGIYCE